MQSVVACIAYHQNAFAHRNSGAIRRAVSQTFSPVTSWFDCFQNCTSPSARSCQPFPTMPCALGGSPVSIVDCEVHVTAGSGGRSVRTPPVAFAKDRRRGVASPIRFDESPTMLITQVRWITAEWYGQRCESWVRVKRVSMPRERHHDEPSIEHESKNARHAPRGRVPSRLASHIEQ